MKQIFLMFPGQGSQFSGMGKDYFENFKEAKLAFEEASDATGLSLKKLCFEGSDEDLKATEITQPALLTVSTSIFRSLRSTGLFENKELLFAGHSLGEYSALVAMGAIPLGVAAKLVRHRGLYMQEAVPVGRGAMAAFIFKPGASGTELAVKICAEAAATSKSSVSVANFNSFEQIVISGDVAGVEAAQEIGLARPEFQLRKSVPLAVSAPFHCQLMEPAAKRLAPELSAAPWKKTEYAYIANVDAALHDSESQVALRLEQQICSSVLWVQSVVRALSEGYQRSFEVGPGAVLTGLAKRITANEKSLSAESLQHWESAKNVSN